MTILIRPVMEGLPEGSIVFFLGRLGKVYFMVYGPSDAFVVLEGSDHCGFSSNIKIVMGGMGEDMLVHDAISGYRRSNGNWLVSFGDDCILNFKKVGSAEVMTFNNKSFDEVYIPS